MGKATNSDRLQSPSTVAVTVMEEQQKNQEGEEISSYVSQLHVVPAVDAVEAGKGQLEISVNQGKVPNNVQMQGAGRCLVTFIPQFPGQYVIDVTFNGEQVYGIQFIALRTFFFCFFFPHTVLNLKFFSVFFVFSVSSSFSDLSIAITAFERNKKETLFFLYL